MSEVVTTGYSYERVPPDIAADARELAARIKERGRAAILDTGRDLLSIKERLGHGHFGRWLAAEFQWTERSAQRYIQAYEVFREVKSDIVSVLPATLVYQLAAPSTP